MPAPAGNLKKCNKCGIPKPPTYFPAGSNTCTLCKEREKAEKERKRQKGDK